jgi:transcriptional regulator with XRE-family HTH domain
MGRKLLGLNQTELGEALGVTFQQLQKYEKGTNRISASRLFDLSHVLNVPVSFFFEDIPAKVTEGGGAKRWSLSEPTRALPTQRYVRCSGT